MFTSFSFAKKNKKNGAHLPFDTPETIREQGKNSLTFHKGGTKAYIHFEGERREAQGNSQMGLAVKSTTCVKHMGIFFRYLTEGFT